MELIKKCREIISEVTGDIEAKLSLRPGFKVAVLEKFDDRHSHLGKHWFIEGVACDNEELVTIYPYSIWNNSCGLLPEPYNWMSFRENVIRVYAHEMRHIWQIQNGTYYDDNAEPDADDFAYGFLKSLVS